MTRKKEESLEFEESEHERLKKVLAASSARKAEKEEPIVRDSYRVPCAEEDKAEVVIKGRNYAVANVGSCGLGIILPGEHSLREGEELDPIEFHLREQKISLKGLVVHISMEESDSYLCGVALIEMEKSQAKKIREFIQLRRQALFAGREKK